MSDQPPSHAYAVACGGSDERQYQHRGKARSDHGGHRRLRALPGLGGLDENRLTSAAGKPKTVRMVLDHTLVKDNYVLAYDWGTQAVSWKLIEGTLLKAIDGSYVLKPNGAGTTVIYTLTVDINMPMISMFKRKAEKTIIDGALKGLKKRVEG